MEPQKNHTNRFVVCLNNDGYQASLEVSKIYQVIPDEEANVNGLIRIIDESGEDYAFPLNRFYPIEVPRQVEETLMSRC